MSITSNLVNFNFFATTCVTANFGKNVFFHRRHLALFPLLHRPYNNMSCFAKFKLQAPTSKKKHSFDSIGIRILKRLSQTILVVFLYHAIYYFLCIFSYKNTLILVSAHNFQLSFDSARRAVQKELASTSKTIP